MKTCSRSAQVNLFVGGRHFGPDHRNEACLVSVRLGLDFDRPYGICALNKGELEPTLTATTHAADVEPDILLLRIFEEHFGQKASVIFKTLHEKGKFHLLGDPEDGHATQFWILVFDEAGTLFDAMVDMKKRGSFEIEDAETLSRYERDELRTNKLNSRKPKKGKKKMKVGKPNINNLFRGVGTFRIVRIADPDMFSREALRFAQKALKKTQALIDEARAKEPRRVAKGSYAH